MQVRQNQSWMFLDVRFRIVEKRKRKTPTVFISLVPFLLYNPWRMDNNNCMKSWLERRIKNKGC